MTQILLQGKLSPTAGCAHSRGLSLGLDSMTLVMVVCEGTGRACCGHRRLMQSLAAVKLFLLQAFTGSLEPATVEG